jgi:hypothetical protein
MFKHKNLKKMQDPCMHAVRTGIKISVSADMARLTHFVILKNISLAVNDLVCQGI